MTSLNDEETLAGSPRGSLASHPTKISDASSHTLKSRPWRRRTTPFESILNENYKGKGTVEEPYIISWLDNDPENPQNYNAAYKWMLTMLVSLATLSVALASSAYSGAVNSLSADFGPSREVLILGVSLFVVGFALGPLFWAPLSEISGRRLTFVISYTFYTLWNAVTVASPNMGAVLVFRFLAGAFGSSPLTNAGGTIADMFNAEMRGLATAIFAACPFLGPSIGPVVGGFLGTAAGWRWVEALLAIFAAVITVVGFLFLPETYAPTLLRARAKKLSKVTGKYYRASMDEKQELNIKQLWKTSLIRPWILLFKEPIVLILSLYMSIVYGALYLNFAAYPIVFQQGRGWSPGIGGLAFLGILVGMLVGIAYIIVYENPRYVKLSKQMQGSGPVPPEARLPPAMLGSILLVIGLAWFAATCSPSVQFVVPIAAGAPFGCGMLLVFISTMNYLIDAYVIYAASVLAANSVLRSLFGAAFPLFTSQMYNALGIHWASAIPGFLCLACLPFPFIFYKYGSVVREKCKYAREAAQILARMTAGQQKQAPQPEKEKEDQH